MLTFDYPWMFVLLLAPVAVAALSRAYQEHRAAVAVPFFEEIVKITGRRPSAGSAVLVQTRIQKWLLWTVWILIVTAMANPQWVGEPIQKIESGRDMMLVVDLSGSMQAEDFTDPQGNQVNRLDAVKLVLDDFITQRKGDRLGLVLFGNAAYLQAPFTLDHDTVRDLLEQTQLGIAGVQTMMGDAMGLCIKLFEQSQPQNKVVILLTDGNDTGSRMPPLKAADIAAENDIMIFTVAVGNPETIGEEALDLDTLNRIANTTGGQSYQALDTQQLQDIYTELDQIVPEEFDTISYRPKKMLFHWPLGALISIMIAYHLIMVIFSLMKKKNRAAIAHAA